MEHRIGIPIKMGKSYHKTLTTYLNGLLTNGFELLNIVEPQPPVRMLSIEGMKDEMRRPMMLIIAARKKENHRL